jgi:hypothetical protein
MPQEHLDYEPIAATQRSSALVADFAIILAVVVGTNALLFALANHERQQGNVDFGWRCLIAVGPANVVIGVLSGACTPLFKRLSGRQSAREHIVLSVAIPVVATIWYAFVLMSHSP